MKFLVVALLVIQTLPAFAGNEGGSGSNELTRLLLKAKTEELPRIINKVDPSDPAFDFVPKLREKYFSVRGKILSDLRSINLNLTPNKLYDSKNNYPTWMSLNGSEIRYNASSYYELVRTVPQLSMMSEVLLHEMGHYYDLNEDDAWSFARLLIFASQRPVRSKIEDPSALAVKIEINREKIDNLLNSKFQTLTREKIAEYHATLNGSLHGSFTQRSPMASMALGGLLGAGLGGAAGATYAELFPVVAGAPELLIPAIVGAGLGTLFGTTAGAFNPMKTAEGQIDGEIHGEFEGSQWQTFSAPTLYSTSVVDLAKVLRIKQAMEQFPNVKTKDCTFRAINILIKMAQARAALSPLALGQLSNLMTEYNNDLNSLKIIANKYLMQPQVGAGIRAAIESQEKWSLPKRLMVLNLNYNARDFIGKCEDTDAGAMKALGAHSALIETFLVNFQQNDVSQGQE